VAIGEERGRDQKGRIYLGSGGEDHPTRRRGRTSYPRVRFARWLLQKQRTRLRLDKREGRRSARSC